jgi:lipoprotein-anchoring transpeptidase ErfK/SrfK
MVLAGVSASSGHGPSQHKASRAARVAASSTTTTTTQAASAVPAVPAGNTLLATVNGVSWDGQSEVLPVIASNANAVEVRLPGRPNSSVGWLGVGAVSFSYTPWKIEIDTTSDVLTLLDAGSVVMSAPVGVGASDDPTPSGEFFVAYKAQAPSADYGPWVLVTSAHSDAIANWEGTGDANIGIHGPLGEDALIPGAISHGCIRMHLSDLAKLGVVPAGTPVSISA